MQARSQHEKGLENDCKHVNKHGLTRSADHAQTVWRAWETILMDRRGTDVCQALKMAQIYLEKRQKLSETPILTRQKCEIAQRNQRLERLGNFLGASEMHKHSYSISIGTKTTAKSPGDVSIAQNKLKPQTLPMPQRPGVQDNEPHKNAEHVEHQRRAKNS